MLKKIKILLKNNQFNYDMYNLLLYHNNEMTNNVLIYIYETQKCENFSLHSIKNVKNDVYDYVYKLDIQQEPFCFQFCDQEIRITNMQYSQEEDLDSCGRYEKNVRLKLSARKKSTLQNFIQSVNSYFIERMNNHSEDELVVLRYNYGWEQQIRIHKRPVDTIYIPKKIKEDLLTDLKTFHSEEFKIMFKNLSLVHRRTYLLYGIPGSGKTSTVKAIASEYDKKIAILEFDNELNDKSLKIALQRLPKNSLLLIEDIDCLFNERKLNDSFKNNITFSGLLNALDGIIQTQDTMIFITTNHIEQLDDALKRRIDYFVEYTYANIQEIKDMYTSFFPTKSSDEFHCFYNKISDLKLSINTLQKFFTKYYKKDLYQYISELYDTSNQTHIYM